MINKVNNNCTFGANFETHIRIKDKTRLKKIKQLFENATKQYPNETLYISNAENNQSSIHITKVRDKLYSDEVLINQFGEYLNTMSDAEIVQRLSNVFKVLRLSNIYSNLRQAKHYNEEKLVSNLSIADNLRKFGKDSFADKYEKFANFNREKIRHLKTQLSNVEESFYKQREKTSKEVPEVMNVEII